MIGPFIRISGEKLVSATKSSLSLENFQVDFWLLLLLLLLSSIFVFLGVTLGVKFDHHVFTQSKMSEFIIT